MRTTPPFVKASGGLVLGQRMSEAEERAPDPDGRQS
jgi:hypothetical protein